MRSFAFIRKREFLLGAAIGYIVAVLCATQSLLFNVQTDADLDFSEEGAASTIDFAEVTNKPGRIFCWVVTSPKNKVKANTVKHTWGKRCDKLLFMSSKKDPSLPAVGLPIKEESRDQLWEKAKMTFKLIYSRYLNDFDWFLKADDDTYVVMENLRSLLAAFNSSEPYFLGHEFEKGSNKSYLSGGAGYALSRETMRRLVDIGLNKHQCPEDFKGEEDDVTLTQCLYKIGAIIPSTNDRRGYHRFLSCNVEQFFNGQVGKVRCRPDKDSNCLSTEPITFHYLSAMKMLEYEFLLYRARVVSQLSAVDKN